MRSVDKKLLEEIFQILDDVNPSKKLIKSTIKDLYATGRRLFLDRGDCFAI